VVDHLPSKHEALSSNKKRIGKCHPADPSSSETSFSHRCVMENAAVIQDLSRGYRNEIVG
jgi:hypothetical protein